MSNGSDAGPTEGADEMATTSELPALAGTPKQVVWAEKIRATFLRDLDALAVRVAAESATRDEDRRLLDKARRLALSPKLSARWWIDTRDLGPRGLVAMIVKAERSDAQVAADRDAAAERVERARVELERERERRMHPLPGTLANPSIVTRTERGLESALIEAERALAAAEADVAKRAETAAAR